MGLERAPPGSGGDPEGSQERGRESWGGVGCQWVGRGPLVAGVEVPQCLYKQDSRAKTYQLHVRLTPGEFPRQVKGILNR